MNFLATNNMVWPKIDKRIVIFPDTKTVTNVSTLRCFVRVRRLGTGQYRLGALTVRPTDNYCRPAITGCVPWKPPAQR